MSTQNDYLKQWESIANAHDLTSALMNHFSYLAEDSAEREILEFIMIKANRVTADKDKLSIYFSNVDARLIATPPLTDIPEPYPETFKDLLRKHRPIEFFALLKDINGYIENLDTLGNYSFRKKGNGRPYLYFIHTDDPPVTHPQRDNEFLEKVGIYFATFYPKK